jgi:hypothetical protein
VTIVSSVVPVGVPFEVVGFPRAIDPGEGNLSSNTKPRKWDRSFGTAPGLAVAQSSPATSADGVVYMTIDLRGGVPEVKMLSEEEYFQLVMDMQDVLSRGGETGIGGEPD